ncbi:MAG TPA: tRNA pseudouridine(38-40) synthase TruA [Gemmatimonadales bacterium]|nr:tRNA pseudouridine(38-40) synthase TruA [Gemmatimonadales bacterium]
MAARPTLLLLQYDGGAFAGWQRQPAARTVQGDVEDILARLLGRPTPVIGAGRTDAGVHATGQAAAAMVPERWTPQDLVRAMNALLPSDIWIASASRMVAGFNPRRHAVERTYCYRIGTDAAARSPFRWRYEWGLAGPLDAALLAAAARQLVGEHSFLALSAKGPERAHWRCKVLEALWLRREQAEGLEFWITADRFLHHMVRFVVGLMVDIARGRRPLGDLRRLLAARDNREASPPAPAHGLFLVGVRYPKHLYVTVS